MRLLYTCISGLQDVVRAIVEEDSGHRVIKVLDGALICEAEHPSRAGCFNNTFEILLERPFAGKNVLDRMMAEALVPGIKLPLFHMKGMGSTFRIVSSMENKLVAVNAASKARLEQLIAKRTGLHVERAGADVEFWLYSRSEGLAFLLRRLSYGRVTERSLQKGELRPELCWCLNWLSRPSDADVFLDPFAGSGAIPLARMQMGGFKKLYAFDSDPAKGEAIGKRLGLDDRIEACAQEMEALALSGVTAVVTDPPWGFFEQIDVGALYEQMWQKLMEISAADARYVILAARTEEMQQAIDAQPGIALEQTYSILVNGKKAGICVARREGKMNHDKS